MFAIDKPKRKAIDANTCLNKHGTDRQTDGRTDGRTDGQTHPLIEMLGRI